MVRWHHQLNGHESEQTVGDTEGQGSLACFGPWSHRVRHVLATEQQERAWIPHLLIHHLAFCTGLCLSLPENG